MPRPDAGDESGMATLWGLAMIGILLLLAATSAGVVSVIGARHQAEAAADLAALAGAQAAVDGEDACRAADQIADANRGELVRCVVQGDVVEVRVEVESPRLLGKVWVLAGRARAGPTESAM